MEKNNWSKKTKRQKENGKWKGESVRIKVMPKGTNESLEDKGK
jgi:hypothetical protein